MAETCMAVCPDKKTSEQWRKQAVKKSSIRRKIFKLRVGGGKKANDVGW